MLDSNKSTNSNKKISFKSIYHKILRYDTIHMIHEHLQYIDVIQNFFFFLIICDNIQTETGN